jgi:hypothetical protein
MGNNMTQAFSGLPIVLIMIILTLSTGIGFASAAVSDEKIIFNGPFFENYGQGFSNWSGDMPPPSGTLLLKGTLSVLPDTVNAGESVEFTLNLDVSAMTITGKSGATIKASGERIWSLDTTKLLGEQVDFQAIPDPELLGVGIGSLVPDLILRSTKRIQSVSIPETGKPGVYPIRAFIKGTDLRTNSVNLTVLNGSATSEFNNSSVLEEPGKTLEITSPAITIPVKSDSENQTSDLQIGAINGKIINEREIHVTSIYPFTGGAGNTMGIKIYGDHFTSPVYVTLVKDNMVIDAYNYCFAENQKYGVVMIDIPVDAELGTWNLVITTNTGKATIPFEVTPNLIEPVILSVDAPVLTPDAAEDVSITGRELIEPCEVLLAGDNLKWFSFYPKPVVMHNAMKIRVKIDAPLSDEITSGKMDLCVWNTDGVASTYKKAISFSLE